jgi:RNA polymerase sigma-70 factor (ECF subfamily)
MSAADDDLVRAHADLVYATCLRLTGNAQDAADVSQEVFIAWMQQRGSIRGPVAAWLHGTARRRSFDWLRRHHRRAQHERQSEAPAVSEEANDAEVARTALDACLAELDARQRTLVIEHHLLGLSQESLAARWSISQTTVSRLLAQAAQRLRRGLARHGITTATVGGLLVMLDGLKANEPCPNGLADPLLAQARVHGASSLVGAGSLTGWRTAWPAISAACLAGILALGAACLAWPSDRPVVAMRRADVLPPPAAHPPGDPVAEVAVIVLPVDYRRDSVRSVCLDLGLRAGLRHGVRILCPAAVAAGGPITIQDQGMTVRAVLDRVAAATGLEVRTGTRSLTLIRHAEDRQLADLSAILTGKDADQRADAVCALGDLGDERVWQPLLAVLADPVPELRRMAMDALRRQLPVVPEGLDRGAAQAAIAAGRAVADSRWEQLALAELAGACAVPLPAGSDPELVMRWQGAARAADSPPADELLVALDALTAPVVAGVLGGAADPTATALLDRAYPALTSGGIEATTWFCPRWRAQRWLDRSELPPEDNRAIVLGLACRAGCGALLPHLIALTEHHDPLLRERAALALGYAGDPRALQALGRLLETSHGREIRQLGLWALGELRGVDSIALIATVLEDVEVGIEAMFAISRTGRPAGADVLRPLAENGHGVVKNLAAWLADGLRQNTSLSQSRPRFRRIACQQARCYSGYFSTEQIVQQLERLQSDPLPVLHYLKVRSLDGCQRTAALSSDLRRKVISRVVREWDDGIESGTGFRPGDGIPAAIAAEASLACSWNNGRRSTIVIAKGSGLVRQAVVTTSEGDGRLIVSYAASAFVDTDGFLRIDGFNVLMSGPRSGDWAPESFVIRAAGQVSMIDDQGMIQNAVVEGSPLAEPPKAADF